MAKRIILIPSFPVCVALVIIALILAGVGHGQSAVSKAELPASTTVDIGQAKSQIISLVNLGKLDDANTAVDKLIADYAKDANLTSTLAGNANQYAWDRKYDDANRLYSAVIDNHPDKMFTFSDNFISL